jgi:hypothetical protein
MRSGVFAVFEDHGAAGDDGLTRYGQEEGQGR